MSRTDPDRDALREGLARIRARRRRLWLVFWTYIPGVLGISFALQGLGVVSEAPVIAVALGWMGLFGVTSFQSGFSRCPRCQHFFHMRGGFGNGFARRCMNCGLPLRGR